VPAHRAQGGTGRGADRGSGRPAGPGDPLREEVRRSAARSSQGVAAAEAFDRARDLLERARDAAAAQAAAEARALVPRSGAVRELLGMALYRTGRYRDALRELQAYRRITGRQDQNHLMADCYRAIGAPEKAVPLVHEAMRARIGEEARAEAAVVGAAALADLGRFTEAVGMLRSFPTSLQAARPSDLRIWYVAGDVLERAGRKKEAAEEFRRVVRHEAGAYDAAERLAALGG
jgi:tetratricopeptide (TPR) repeat protein